jgi:transcription-repair coupling factor (superfamily II helicase)
MLNEEVLVLTGKKERTEEDEEELDSKPLLDVATHIDEKYVDDDDLIIEIHKKINEIDSYEKLVSVKEELEDRFGKLDEKVITYMYEEWFESLAKKNQIEEVHQTKNFIEIVFSEEMSNKIDGESLFYDAVQLSRMFRFQMKHNRLIVILDTIKLEDNYIILLTKLFEKIKIKEQ